MRCPKCGFISFDHLDFCRRCNKSLDSVSLALRGSVHDCQAPVFLRCSQLEEDTETVDNYPLNNVADEVEIVLPNSQVSSSAWPEEKAAAFLVNGEESSGCALAESENDFDLDLGLDFDSEDQEQDARFEAKKAASAADSPKEQAVPVDMDSDLDFELDLGELSLHDYGTSRK
ncbi:MAG TPA: hypothetical protein DEB25_03620 [Desulfobulbaceae bacterium]|nr:hypothetical protein [Desulfobulbaceae bacterium]